MPTMVNELLDHGVIESGELKIQPEDHLIADLLNKSVYLNNIQAAKEGFAHRDRSELTDAILSIDADKVKQVVNNLPSNAIKFSPPNSIIRVGMKRDSATYSVLVRDQGPGIPETERQALQGLQPDLRETDCRRKEHRPRPRDLRASWKRTGATSAPTSLPAGGSEFRITFPSPRELPQTILRDRRRAAHPGNSSALVLRQFRIRASSRPQTAPRRLNCTAAPSRSRAARRQHARPRRRAGVDAIRALDPESVVVMLTSWPTAVTVEECSAPRRGRLHPQGRRRGEEMKARFESIFADYGYGTEETA